jgi:hypothetical protein
MNSGNSVQDSGLRGAPDVPASAVDVPAPEEGQRDTSSGQPFGSRPRMQHLQDIQEIIDKLAAVTRQLRHPGNS